MPMIDLAHYTTLIATLEKIAHHAAACRASSDDVASRAILSQWLVEWRKRTQGIDESSLIALGDALGDRRLVEASIVAALIANPSVGDADRAICAATWDVFRRTWLGSHRPTAAAGDVDEQPQRQRGRRRTSDDRQRVR